MTATLVATPEPNNVPPRVRLDLTWTGHTTATISRHDPDGRVRPVRLAEPVTISGGVALVYDYESWFGQSMTYDATDSTTISSSAVTLSVSSVWLRNPGIPSLSVIVEIAGDGSPIRAANRGVHRPLARQYPIVITDGRRKSKSTTMLLRTWTLADIDALNACLDNCNVVLLDVPPANPWGITHQYMAVGDLTEIRQVEEIAENPFRQWQLPYDEVSRPAGGLQSQRTYANLLVDATYAQMDAAYLSYTNVLSGVRIGS